MIKRLLTIPKKRLLKKILGYDEIYTVALRKWNENTLPQGNTEVPFVPIKYSRKYWYADPILFSYKGKEYLFVEEFDRNTSKGQLAVAEVLDSPKDMEFRTVISEPYHMSFPMVFEWNEKIFMIPETSENYSINIYQAVDFPYKWKCISCIKTEKKYVDSVVLEKNNRNLTLLTSEVCDGNPLKVRFKKIVIDIDKLKIIIPDIKFNKAQIYNLIDRNAGPIVKIDNHEILSTQESTCIDYGVSLAFRQTTETSAIISKYGIKDIIIDDLEKRNMVGIHTYSKTDKYEVIDVRYLKFSPLLQYRKLLK